MINSTIIKGAPLNPLSTEPGEGQLTTYGRKVALFFTKLDARIFRQFLAAIDDSQPIPLPLSAAFEQVEQAVAELVDRAHLAPSAA